MRVGSIVQYKDFGDGIRTVKVTKVCEVKGRPGFEGICLDRNTLTPALDEDGRIFPVWGYNYQVFMEIL